jgi:phage gpG-like protein
LLVGSNKEYAAMQQFGGTKAQFPHLWGDIPARPFMGVSDDDERELLALVHDHLLDAARR